MTRPIRVLCVDDDPGAVWLLEMTVDLEPDMQCVGSLDRADRLVEETSRREPDVVLLDYRMPGRDPVEAIQELARIHPRTRVIVLTGFDDPDLVQRVQEAGASGCVSKNCETEDVLQAVRRVARGMSIV